MGTDGNGSLSNDGIGGRQRDAIIDLLTKYYLGQGKMRDLLETTGGISKTTYYRLRELYPDEFDEIDKTARVVALHERSAARLAFESEHEEASRELQRVSREALTRAVQQMAEVAEGVPRDVDVLVNRRSEDDGGWERVYERKTIVPYPRDQIGAYNALLATAKEGIVPERLVIGQVSTAEHEADSSALPPLFSVSTSFKRLTAQTADGTRVTATVDHPDSIIEMEIPDEDGEL